MRQRVELARALGGETPLLLMDEPFSSLDYLTRLKMRRELARILREQPRTVVLVTHDIEEAAQLADRVLVLSERPARVRDEVVLDDAPAARSDASRGRARGAPILTVLGLELSQNRRVAVASERSERAAAGASRRSGERGRVSGSPRGEAPRLKERSA